MLQVMKDYMANSCTITQLHGLQLQWLRPNGVQLLLRTPKAVGSQLHRSFLQP